MLFSSWQKELSELLYLLFLLKQEIQSEKIVDPDHGYDDNKWKRNIVIIISFKNDVILILIYR